MTLLPGSLAMKHLVLTQFGTPSESVALHDDPDPAPGPGDVLVRMEAAAVNPSDLLLVRGKSNRLCRPRSASSRSGRRPLHRAAQPSSRPRVPQRRRGDRPTQRSEPSVALPARLHPGRPAGRCGFQAERLADVGFWHRLLHSAGACAGSRLSKREPKPLLHGKMLVLGVLTE